MTHPDVESAVTAILRGTTAAELETQNLDFKTEKPSAKETWQDLADAAVCFANATGGRIVLGVSDGTPGLDALRGSAMDVHQLRANIHDLTEPHMLVHVTEYTAAGTRLLVVDVPEGIDVYSTSRGVHAQRFNDRCVPMRPIQVARLQEERRGVDWSSQRSETSPDQIDPAAMTAMRSLLLGSSDPSRESLARLDDRGLLQELNLIHADALTHAGTALLVGSPAGVNTELVVYQHRQTRSGEADCVQRWSGPMLTVIPQVLSVISARLSGAPVTTSRGQQFILEDFPSLAVREALVNALMHGDLRDARPVQVEHSPEQLSITSPGPLVAGITPQNILTHGSRPRFAGLSKALRVLGLAEELGRGVDRMYREAVRSGRATPRVRVLDEEVPDTVVEFTGGPANVRLARFVAELPTAEQSDTDALLTAHVLCERSTVTAAYMSPIIQRSAEEAQTVLRRLATGDAQILEPTVGTANRRYPNYRLTGAALASLGPAVTYNKKSVSETDREIVGHVRDFGVINSAAVQRLFDLDVYQARDIIRDLVGREILVRVSVQKRGTAVRYGPGPRFPPKSRRGRDRAGEQSQDDLFS